MKKSEVPTSEYNVSCDTFDTTLSCKMHKTKSGEQKVLISIKEQSVSLYKEDIEMLTDFLNIASEYTKARN